MKNLQSYYQSTRTISSILRYKEDQSHIHKIEIKNYDGLNGLNPPVKIISPQINRNKIVILYPGASPHAEKHPKMEMLGISLANNGYKVFIPRIPPLKKLDISTINVNWFVCFYNWVINVCKHESHSIAMVGVSYGGGLMLKAILQLEKEDKSPHVLMTYGTYADAKSTLNFLLTGEIINDGKKYKIQPHEWGLIVIFKNYLTNLDLNWDAMGIKKVLDFQIEEKFDDRDKLINKLPSFQKQLATSIINGEVTGEAMSLSKEILQNETKLLKELSPKFWCHEIQKKIFIFHGANDSMVPFTESKYLADHMPNSELLISYIYEHKEISTNRGMLFKLKELIRMTQFFSKFYYYNEN